MVGPLRSALPAPVGRMEASRRDAGPVGGRETTPAKQTSPGPSKAAPSPPSLPPKSPPRPAELGRPGSPPSMASGAGSGSAQGAPGAKGSAARVDLDQLALSLKALSNPVRLEMLAQLRRATPLSDIHLQPRRDLDAGSDLRPMSRVTVRQHLEPLLVAGLVKSLRLVREGRAIDHFQLDQAQLWAVIEQVRDLARIAADRDVLDGTMLAPPPSDAHGGRGPHLVLVHGVREGRGFPLQPRAGFRTVVGRREGHGVRLEYDGFSSLDNAEVRWEEGTFVLVDVPGNRNGTRINGKLLESGQKQRLVAGDVIGVGRSLLVFRAGEA